MSIGYGYKWTQTGTDPDQSGVATFTIRGLTVDIKLGSLSDAQKVAKLIEHVAKLAKVYAELDVVAMVMPELVRIKERADATLAGVSNGT